jgi:signal transduction histidine kinase
MAALAGTYYGAARFGYTLQFSGPVAAIVWLPAGVGMAFLSLGGLALWPGVLVGDLLANDYSILPLGSALAQTAGNILEVVVAAALIRRFMTAKSPLAEPAQIVRMLLAICVGTTISATIGVSASLAGGVIAVGAVPTVWRTWWLGDTVGALLVVPLALAWHRPAVVVHWRRRVVEGVGLIGTLFVLSEAAMHGPRPLTYLLFPPLIWAALRFGSRGATLAIAVVAALTVWNTTHYVGPFVFHSPTRSVLSAQLFIAVAAVSTLVLSAFVAQRQSLIEDVGAAHARLVAATDRERHRIERNLHDGAQQRLVALAALLHEGQRLEGDPAFAPRAFAEAEREVRVAIEELRELASGLHPPVLTDFGLARAIHRLAARMAVPVVVGSLPAGDLEDTVEATAYYVVAEAFANAQKHAQPTFISVRAECLRDRLCVAVSDDGVGGAMMREGGGLEGLRERVENLGGTFELRSPPGGGTSLSVEIPLSTT